MNATFHGGPTAPVFLMVGGEMDIATWWSILEGQVLPLAVQHSALVLAVEGRFFGHSWPTENLSTAAFVEAQFSPRTALLDIASAKRTLISDLGISPDAPWVAFGCSYSGVLAAWLRNGTADGLPSPVIGSIANSAPITPIAAFTAYNERVLKPLAVPAAGGSARCSATATAALKAVSQAIQRGPQGLRQLDQAFNTCTPLTPEVDDVDVFLRSTLDVTVGFSIVQSNLPRYLVGYFCNYLLNDTSLAPLDAWAQAVRVFGGGGCVDSNFSAFLSDLAPLHPPPSSWSRQYYWLKCTALGWFHVGSASSPLPPGSLDLPHFFRMCQRVFGLSSGEVTSGIQATAAAFGTGAEGGRALSNVMFVNGGLDPWTALAPAAGNPHHNVSVVQADVGAHCSACNVATPYDPPGVVAARADVGAFVARLLA